MIVRNHGLKEYTPDELRTMREPELNAIVGQILGQRWMIEVIEEERGAFLSRREETYAFRLARPEEIPTGEAINSSMTFPYCQDWERAFFLVGELRDAPTLDAEREDFQWYIDTSSGGIFELSPRKLAEAFVFALTRK